MKKLFSKSISMILAATLLAGSVMFTSVMAAEPSVAGGWNETVYAEWSDSDPTNATVEYRLSGSSAYIPLTGEDKNFLQRAKTGTTARVDIVGLTPGMYDLKITSSTGTVYEKSGIEVAAYDRSGFAHFNYTEGVGAYKDDGTIKENAKILYVTNENKDTVTISSKDGTTVTGIGHILNSRGAVSNTEHGGSLTNNNKGIIGKLAADGTPLVVRIIGSVELPDGLTAYDSYDYGGSEGDNGRMARMSGGKDITIEGIGYDAQLSTWGIHFICQTADYAQGFGKSFEVRNVTFNGAWEDAVGMEGQQSGSSLTAPVQRCWIHHCSFIPPKVSSPAESDKAGGDGACDFKRGMYFTNSYCYYENYHKTNLVGSSDTSMQYHMTYHHNHWKSCESRGPLGRQANIHMYNNYYEGQTSYAMQTRANCYIFSEFNTFFNCKNPQQIKGSGAIKSYGDNLVSCIEAMQATVVTDKSQKVSSGNKYENFDTDSSLGYIANGDYLLTESAAEAAKECLAYAGPMKEVQKSTDDVDFGLVSSENMPTGFVNVPYSIETTKVNLPSIGRLEKDNIIYNISKTANDGITIKGQGVVFKVGQEAIVTMKGVSGSYVPLLYSSDGKLYITQSGSAAIPAGTYVIQSSGFDSSKKDYKECRLTSLEIIAYDPNFTTTTEATTIATTEATEATTEATTNEKGETETQNPDESTESTTAGDIPSGGYIWNYTNGVNTDNFFTVDANDWSGAKEITYSGLTLNSAIKMESGTNISFNAPAGGKLTIVSYSTKTPPKAKLNGKSFEISQNGAVTIDVSAGTNKITKDSASSYIYYMQFVGDGSENPTEATTSEPITDDNPTEATTSEPITDDNPTETTTSEPITDDNPTEATTSEPITDDNPTEATTSEPITGDDPTEATTSSIQVVNKYDFEEGAAGAEFPKEDAYPVDNPTGAYYTLTNKTDGTASDNGPTKVTYESFDGSMRAYVQDKEASAVTVNFITPFVEQNSGVIEVIADIRPDTTANSWTLMQLHGKNASGANSEIIGIRTDSKKYGYRINGVNPVTTLEVPNTADVEVNVKMTVDIDNGTAYIALTPKGATTTTSELITGLDVSAVTLVNFMTAGGARSIYVDNVELKAVSDEQTSEESSETSSEESSESSSEESSETSSEESSESSSEESSETSSESETYAAGDVDGNGRIDASDAARTLMYVLNKASNPFDSKQIKAASFNSAKETVITATNAAKILRKSLDSSYELI